VKPFLGTVIVSGTLHVYVSQTDRGELVFGASVDPFTSYSMRGSLPSGLRRAPGRPLATSARGWPAI
jgi:hypothetical protein